MNPHAGESGTLGTEELTLIEPAVRALAAEGLRVIGPVSADTAFTPESLARCDVVVAMYHDQGLPVLKALSFGEIVNVTLGLPIVRTSVDHGTALALAGHRPRATRQPVRRRRARARARLSARSGAREEAPRPALPARPWRPPQAVGAIARSRRPHGRDRPRPRRAHRRRSSSGSIGCTSSRSIASLRPRCPRASRIPSGSWCTRPTRCASTSAPRGRARTSARGRQPALQHLDAAAVPPARLPRRRSRTCT